MLDQQIFPQELNAEAETLSKACKAIAEAGENLWDDKHQGISEKLEALSERCVDHIVDSLGKFQIENGVNIKPLGNYFVLVLMQDSSVRTAIESKVANYEALQQEALCDIFRNASENSSVGTVINLKDMIEAQTIDIRHDPEKFAVAFKRKYESYMGNNKIVTSELRWSINDAIKEPNENPFALRVFSNLLDRRADGVVHRVLTKHDIKADELFAPMPAKTTAPRGHEPRNARD